MDTKSEILSNLRTITENILLTVEENYSKIPFDTLAQKPSPSKWSVIECLEHLNLYGDFYIPEFQEFLIEAQPDSKDRKFKPGILGNYFANSMKVGQDGSVSNKMNTFKSKNPSKVNLRPGVLDRFVKQQREFVEIINKSEQVDINQKGIPITITSLINLKLGDALRFIIFHNERHIYQAEKVLNEVILLESK